MFDLEDQSTEIVQADSGGYPDTLASLDKRRGRSLASDRELLNAYEFDIKQFRGQSRSPNTVRAYRSDIVQFQKFCDSHNQPQDLPVPAYTVAAFIGWMDRRGLKAVTIQRRLSALSALHIKAGHEDPTRTMTVTEMMEGLRRSRAAEGERAKRARPVDPKMLRAMADQLDTGILDARDWAIMLMGFSGLLRRSEIAALNHDDIDWKDGGIVIHIRKSKTDQRGQGEVVGIPNASDPDICPVKALRRYSDLTEKTGLPSGSSQEIFKNHGAAARHSRINPRVVAHAVKRLAKRAGLDPKLFSGHSLRAGGATTLAESGVDLAMIVVQGRWKDPKTVSKHYVRPADALGDSNAMRGIL